MVCNVLFYGEGACVNENQVHGDRRKAAGLLSHSRPSKLSIVFDFDLFIMGRESLRSGTIIIARMMAGFIISSYLITNNKH